MIIYPSINLKNDWIKKLEERYELTTLPKDYKAMMNAKYRYEENIKELQDNNFIKIEITNMDYDLEKTIKLIEN